MKRLVLLSALFFTAALPAARTSTGADACHVITEDRGGMIGEYARRYDRMNTAHECVKVDGPCMSACTLVLALVDRRRVCVTSRAVFGFHSAYDGETGADAPDATRLMWNVYPADVRARLRARGWNGGARRNEHRKIIPIPGRSLARSCR